MESCISKSSDFALKHAFSAGALQLAVGNDFTAAKFAVDPTHFNKPQTFDDFYGLIDIIIRERKVSLKAAYKDCPTFVHNYFPLKMAEHGYQEYKEGQVNNELINQKAALIILKSLSRVDVYSPDIWDDFDTEDSDRINIHDLNTLIKKEIEKYSPDHAAFAFAFAYRLVPEEVKNEYPPKIAIENFKRHLAGRKVQNFVSSLNAEVILQTIRKAHVLDVEREAAQLASSYSLKPSERLLQFCSLGAENQLVVQADVFREEFNKLKERKKVFAKSVENILPDETREQFKYTTFQNIVYGSGVVKTFSLDLGQAILDAYEAIPDWDAPVSGDEVYGAFPFGDRFDPQMSIDLAMSQINNALEKNGASKAEAEKNFYALIGESPERKLLRKLDGKQNSISRLRVAIFLQLIEGKSVPQDAVDLHNHFLSQKMNSKSFKVACQLPAVGFDDKFSLEDYKVEFNALRDLKKVPFEAVWNSLPKDIVQGQSYLSYRNGSYMGSNRSNLSLHICKAILDVYRELPDYTDRASSNEVNGPFVLGRNFGLMMSSTVAYEQIKEAQREFGVRREVIISRFAELIGCPEDSRLLVKKHGRDKNISRLQVGVILSLIEGKDVPAEAVDLLRHYQGIANASLLGSKTSPIMVENQSENANPEMSIAFNNSTYRSNRFVKLSTRASPSSVTSEMVMALE